VARLAGVPENVLSRAEEICAELIKSDITNKVKDINASSYDGENNQKTLDNEQLDIWSMVEKPDNSYKKLYDEIKALDLNNMTPMNALMYLHKLKEDLR
jgi:DNA mismatch repair protein MutS